MRLDAQKNRLTLIFFSEADAYSTLNQFQDDIHTFYIGIGL